MNNPSPAHPSLATPPVDPTTSSDPGLELNDYLGKWRITIHTRRNAPRRIIRIEPNGSAFRLTSEDGRLDERLEFDPVDFNLSNRRMALSLWRDGSKLFAITRDGSEPVTVWGATEKLSGPAPRSPPAPGLHEPDWRFGKPWKVVAKTGGSQHPEPGTLVVVDPSPDGRHPLRQVGSGVFDHVRPQSRFRTLDGEALRSVARWGGRARNDVFAMVILPPQSMQQLYAASVNPLRKGLLAELGVLPFEAKSLLAGWAPGEEGVAVWGAEEG